MSDSGKSEEYYRSLLPNGGVAAEDKKGKRPTGPKSNKLRKAFGMRGRTQSQKSVGSSKDMEGTIKPQLPAPGTEEKEGEWESIKSNRPLSTNGTSSYHPTPLSQGSTASSTSTSNLPLPGEDDSDVEYEDDSKTSITYALSGPIPPTPDWSQLPSAYAPNPNLQPTHSSSSYAYPASPPQFANSQSSSYPHPAQTQYAYQPSAPPQQTSSPTPPIRPPLPPTPSLNYRPQSTNSTSTHVPSMSPPKPPIPPLPPHLVPAPSPISTPFSIPSSATPSAPPTERSSSTDTSTTSLRLTPFSPPPPSAPQHQIYSPSISSQYSRGYSESIASPAISNAPSLQRSSSIASVPPELYGLQTRRRSSTRSSRLGGGGNVSTGLSNLQDIGEALPDHSGSEKASSVEEDGSGGAWLGELDAALVRQVNLN